MCYYARTDFICGDWKWGNMKLRCPRQQRIGETCGAKLVDLDSVERVDVECRKCYEIQVKHRRLRKAVDNIQRWSRQGNPFPASLEKAQREKVAIEGMIRQLERDRISAQHHLEGSNSLTTSAHSQGNSADRGYGGAIHTSARSSTAASRHAPAVHGYFGWETSSS